MPSSRRWSERHVTLQGSLPDFDTKDWCIAMAISREDVREVFMQAAVYCGIPAALDSFRVAEAVFAEETGT